MILSGHPIVEEAFLVRISVSRSRRSPLSFLSIRENVKAPPLVETVVLFHDVSGHRDANHLGMARRLRCLYFNGSSHFDGPRWSPRSMLRNESQPILWCFRRTRHSAPYRLGAGTAGVVRGRYGACHRCRGRFRWRFLRPARAGARVGHNGCPGKAPSLG